MRIIVSLVAAVALVGAAEAADMAAPVLRGHIQDHETKAIDWSGFYLGGRYTYAGTSSPRFGAGDDLLNTLARGTVFEAPIRQRPPLNVGTNQDGRTGFGVFAGYNWTFDGAVFGVEADYTRARLDARLFGETSGSFCLPACNTLPRDELSYYATTDKAYKITEFGSVRGRVGWAFDNFLPFVTLGVAWNRASGQENAQISATGVRVEQIGTDPVSGIAIIARNPFNPTPFPSSVERNLRTRYNFGYALGAGIDWALTSNIFIRAEAQHLRFAEVGGVSVQLNKVSVGAAVKY